MLLSVDPGLRTCGVALWNEGILHSAKLVRGHKSEFDAPAWLTMADAVSAFTGDESVDTLVIELPQVYQRGGGKTKGDPNDLIQLAAAVGAITTRMNCTTNIVYRPAQWKHQLPKEVIEDRTKQILSDVELRRVDLPAITLRHNVWDAVAIGLYHLKRREPLRSCPPPTS
jgi:RNase H-fold protein (predicted Holliday junction resolvase)